jgi:hypothetical protein
MGEDFLALGLGRVISRAFAMPVEHLGVNGGQPLGLGCKIASCTWSLTQTVWVASKAGNPWV